uniref:Cyclic AMP-dependent transcription factor ATF-4 n=1 Tax=Jaculus jaculus TaxID=51337 RepID=A0A8C5K4B1_JACJA
MTEMSFLSSEVSPFDPSGLGAEESLGLLDDYLEVAKHFKPHGFSGHKAKAGTTEWLAMDGLVSASDTGKEDPFSGTDWMLEKMDLKEFDIDALFHMGDLETMPDELLDTFDDTCDLFAPLVQETDKEPPQTGDPIGHLPESSTKVDQVTPFAFLQPLSFSPGVLFSTPDHSFSLELGSEVDISEGDRKLDTAVYISLTPQCPESYPGSPQHSPSTSGGFPSSVPSPSVPRGSTRPKPYDPPGEMAAKIKVEKLDKLQPGTARKRGQSRRPLLGSVKKNEALKEKADSLAKEIQYLKDLIEEARKARGEKRVP